LVVDGNTSSSNFGSGASESEFGGSGATGRGTFSNGSFNTFLGDVDIGVDGAGGVGIVNVLTGADVGISGDLRIGSDGTVGSSGTLTVNGVGSSSSSHALTLGAAGVSTGTLNVQNLGVFNGGFGGTPITVGATGTIAITGGLFIAGGNMTLNGQMTRDTTGDFALVAGRTLTVQNGGDVTITGSFSNTSASTITVTGAGSTFSTTSSLSVSSGSTLNVFAGADVSSAAAQIGIGVDGNGTVTVDAAGSTLVGGQLAMGSGGATGLATFSNGSSGTFGGISLDDSAVAGSSATLNIQSGADVTGNSLVVAPNAAANNGTVTITGAGSTLTITGGGSTEVGASSASTGALNVLTSSTFNSGTGTILIGATGTVAITGGTFNANGNMTLNGQMTRSSTGDFNLAAGRTLIVQNGGDATITGSFSHDTASIITITGTGSTFSTTTGTLALSAGSTMNVLAGGLLSSGAASIIVGSASDSTVVVDGSGSTFSGNDLDVGLGGAAGSLTFTNSGFGGFAGIDVDNSPDIGTSGVLSIQSGAMVSGTSLDLANQAVANSGSVTITGIGSALTITGAGATTIGAASASTGTLSIQNGGRFTSGTGAFTVNATGIVSIGGGTLTVNGPLTNSGAFSFSSGALNLLDGNNLTIGTGGLLGTSLTLLSNRDLAVAGTTTIDFTRTLTINGGTFRTGALVNNGTLDFQKGTLGITGASGLNIGTGVLGANVVLGIGANLEVTNTTTVSSGAVLTTNGGNFLTGALSNSGLVEHESGVFTVSGALTNLTGGDIFVERTLSVGGLFTNQSGAQLVLLNGTGRVQGAGSLSNSGLIRGDGTVALGLTNAASGELRGESGKTLRFTGTTAPNAGRLNLLGGTLQFTQQFTNSATGQITGEGALYFPTTPVPSSGSPTAGLMNAGNINLTGGDSQIYGTVQMQAGSRLIVSGGATASFFDVFRHSGIEVRASAGSNIVFFGEVRGAGPFTGTGTIYFEGGYSPGNSPASVLLGTEVVFGEANTLTLELGGLAAGSEYDQLVLGANSSLALDGGLVLDLIGGFVPHFGDTFQLFDFDPGQVSGSFDEITIADALPGDLAFDTSALSATGKVTVIPEPGIGALLLSALALLGVRRRCS
jgi:hypothetical protein